MKTFEKGTIVELEVQLELVKRGYQVFTPVNEACKVDLIFINNNSKAEKVQIKKALAYKHGFKLELRYNIGSKRIGKAFYTKKEIDFFGTVFNNRLYLIPISDVEGRNCIRFRFNDTGRKNQFTPLYAKDYEINIAG